MYSNFSVEKAISSLNKMRNFGVDCKVISLHWGWHEEYINIPSPEQIKVARLLIDNGADIIVGHHPHVVQPIEEYKGKLIFYSLGNFLADMIWSKNVRTGMAVNISFEKEKGLKYEIIPLFLGKDFIPHFKDREKFEKHMNKFSIDIKEYDINPNKYTNRRKFQMKSNQYYQRLMMKLFLLKNWNKLIPSAKGKTIKRMYFKAKNVFYKYYN